MPPSPLPIGDAVAQLRTEIIKAVQQARTAQVAFELERIELTLQVVATTAGEGEVGGGLWGVVTANGSIQHGRERTHQIALTLVPRLLDSDGKTIGNILIGDDETDWTPRS